MERVLNLRQGPLRGFGQLCLQHERLPFLPGLVATRQNHAPFGNILGPKLDPQRHAAHLPVVELEARAHAFALVHRDADFRVHQFGPDPSCCFHDLGLLFIALEDRDDHSLVRSELGRQDQPLVVPVHHDDGAHDARGKPPGSCPTMLELPGLVEITNLKGFRKILPEVVRCAELQRLPIPHHGLERIGDIGSGKFLRFRLAAGDHRNSRIIHCEIHIHVHHLARLRFGFRSCRVSCMTLLPEEFQGAQEQLRAQFPAHHAVPLVDQHRQVAVRLDPLRVGVPDDRLRRGADHQRLFEFFPAAVRHHRQLRREPRHVRLFLVNEAPRNQQRKRCVHMTGGLESPVESRRDVFPQSPAIRPHDHASAYGCVVGQLGAQHDLVVPLREIFGARR